MRTATPCEMLPAAMNRSAQSAIFYEKELEELAEDLAERQAQDVWRRQTSSAALEASATACSG
jgi:hypothetical protein